MHESPEPRYDPELLKSWANYTPTSVINASNIEILQVVVAARIYATVLQNDKQVSSTLLEATASQQNASFLIDKIISALDTVETVIQTAREYADVYDMQK